MKNDRGPTPESFARLLAWLDPNQDLAAEKYERLRQRLIRAFIRAGCGESAEHLADETFDRVARRAAEGTIPEPFVGDKALYFHGFVDNICREYRRRPTFREPIPPPPLPDPDVEDEYACLEECVRGSEEYSLAVEYYRFEKAAKIENRRKLSEETGLTLAGLRTRVHRIRQDLRPCIEKCLQGIQVH